MKIYSEIVKIGEGFVKFFFKIFKRNNEKLKNKKRAAGEVFSAVDKVSNRKVAIKQMPLNSANMKMLVTEIGIMKDSKHPAIVEYFDSYIVDNKIWVRIFLLFFNFTSFLLFFFSSIVILNFN